MTSASDYLEQVIYNHIFRNDTFAKPSSIALALTLDVPLDNGTYTEVANSNGYARYANASGNALWDAMAANGSGSNTTEFSFAQATGDWGIVSGIVITDDARYGAGNVLFHGALTSARNIQSGDQFRFNVGGIDVGVS